MAVRVSLRIRSRKGKSVRTHAVLNGGFEISAPHLLLPASLARELFGNYRSHAIQQEMQAATGRSFFYALSTPLRVCVITSDRAGNEKEFLVLVGESEDEVLVSDSGIDALGIRIESFAPGRWRFSDESRIRDSEPPQCWPTKDQPSRRKRHRA